MLLTGLAGIFVLMLLLFGGVPVAFAMVLTGTAGFALVVSPDAALSMMVSDFVETFFSYNLIVIPLFVFMGQVAFQAGISGSLYSSVYKWFGKVKGGLAVATVGACAGFGAICGSGPATAATMTAVAVPEMRKYHYAPELAAGVTAAGGSLGMLIPPSIVFIVYAVMTGQSVGDLFLAGIIPGILIAVLFSIVILVRCALNPRLGPAGPGFSIKEKILSLKGVIETLFLFILVIGGIFKGFFTPTEAAAVGVTGSLLVALIRRRMSFKGLKTAFLETVKTSVMIFAIIAGAVIFSHFLAVTRLPFETADYLASLPLPGFVIMFLIILFYFAAGCFIDALALVLLTIPVFFPVVTKLGYHPVWFGVITVLVTQMGVISPPVGVNAYIVHGISKDIELKTIFRGIIPFLIALFVAAFILIIFPDLVLIFIS